MFCYYVDLTSRLAILAPEFIILMPHLSSLNYKLLTTILTKLLYYPGVTALNHPDLQTGHNCKVQTSLKMCSLNSPLPPPPLQLVLMLMSELEPIL
jgi:hypothetical protein